MYQKLFNNLLKRNRLYRKQFRFQQGHSAEHTIKPLIEQSNVNLENNYFTLGVLIDLLKAFDHQILVSKLVNYGVKGNNLKADSLLA